MESPDVVIETSQSTNEESDTTTEPTVLENKNDGNTSESELQTSETSENDTSSCNNTEETFKSNSTESESTSELNTTETEILPENSQSPKNKQEEISNLTPENNQDEVEEDAFMKPAHLEEDDEASNDTDKSDKSEKSIKSDKSVKSDKSEKSVKCEKESTVTPLNISKDSNADTAESSEVIPTPDESANENFESLDASSKCENTKDAQDKETELSTEKDLPEPNKDTSIESGTSSDNHENLENDSNKNSVFIHVSSETEKENDQKNMVEAHTQENQFDEDFQDNQPQEDPIGSETENQICGSNEMMCIIPDTERIISQEEKDAVASMIPLRDPGDTNAIVNVLRDTIDRESNNSTAVDTDAPSYDELYIISKSTVETPNSCSQCSSTTKAKYSIMHKKEASYICKDDCLNMFKEKHGRNLFIHRNEGDIHVKNLSLEKDDNVLAKMKFVRKCMNCDKPIFDVDLSLSWSTMEFCNEHCLFKYQKQIGSYCATCEKEVPLNDLGKYAVRFGYNIRQFCNGSCLDDFKKGLKVCSYCQEDISNGDGFLAPVGVKGVFKDFCSQICMKKYDMISNGQNVANKTEGSCSVCSGKKLIIIEFEYNNQMYNFCGEPCFVAFNFVNNSAPGKCSMCKKYFDKISEENVMFYDNEHYSFCSKNCQNLYVTIQRKIVACAWCKVKKYNFDLIKRNSYTGLTPMTCSVQCLNFYEVSLSAVTSEKIECYHCHKTLQPSYHIRISDSIMRSFCSYPCIMNFQKQYSNNQITLNTSEDGPVGLEESQVLESPLVGKLSKAKTSHESPTIPIITNVRSLAGTNGLDSNTTTTTTSTITTSTTTTATATDDNSLNWHSESHGKTEVKQQIIIKNAVIPPQRNVGTLCKVITSSKSINIKPVMTNKGVQTDDVQDKVSLIPIPVPIYVPTPLFMYSMPFPVPFPIPLPIPVPIFIPTTRNSANGIMKEIKKIQVKIPTDPFEAELLMMAEMVAEDKKEERTDSESEEEEHPGAPEEPTFSPEPVDASNTFGDDMLQMALKMATELDEPAVDLEGALTASTITASQTAATVGAEQTVEQQPIHQIMERQTVRGRKRPGRPPKSGNVSKRGRRASNQMEIPIMTPPPPQPPPEPTEKPDANMCLKYTFGVNAWKQWVTTKNVEFEKSSKRMKPFKTEILQLTADELNYSLCLFVKEVRKPNGQEYAPDTIYYLCLGIQQYLFENGRIDNIFCDPYYERFTDCLDDVAKKFSVLYNDSHYIVTRVEEEHLWESKQLGAHSPHVLLSTLMFFNTKHFNLTTVDEHMQLSFSHIMKHWKRNPNQSGSNKAAGSRNVLLRFYPPQSSLETQRKKKVYEQQENEENPLRCPVKLYEFYLSKCPESVKTRNDVFYLLPERSCVPDSPVWYSTMPLPRQILEKMLHRVKMVKEINVALLTS